MCARATKEMSDTQNDPKLLAFFLLLVAQSRLNAKFSSTLADNKHVPLDVYDVLVTLEYAPDHRLRLSELADKVLLSRSGLTRRLDRLEKQGYIKREGCPNDRRGAYAVLTEAGLQARESAWPIYKEAIRTYFGDRMTEGEAKQLSAVMKRIIDALDKDFVTCA